MWLEKRGIVAKISGRHCIVITPEGTYEKIPLPGSATQIGTEVVYRRSLVPSRSRPWLMAASFLLIFMSYALLRQVMVPQVAAYVSIDINPSLEISVDKNLQVIAVHYFNDDAQQLVKPGSLKGKNLYAALTEVINQAVEQNYIKPGQDNLIVSTVSSPGTKPAPVDQQAVCQFLEKSVNTGGNSGQVKMYSASEEIRSAAKKEGLSPGKYLVYQQLVKSGKQVSVNDVKKNSIRSLVDKYQAQLLPNYKKFTVQKVKNSGEEEIDVDDNGKNMPIKEYLKSHKQQTDTVNNNQTKKNNKRSETQPVEIKKSDADTYKNTLTGRKTWRVDTKKRNNQQSEAGKNN